MKTTGSIIVGTTLTALIFSLSSCGVKNIKTTVATVVCPHREFPYNCAVIEYRVNDKKYFSRAPRLKYMTKGDKFFMVYDSLNPVKQEVYVEYPIILPHEETLSIKGKILKCITGENSKITYEYYVDGIKYKKLQVLRGFHHFKKGSDCRIKIIRSNPQRSKLEN